MTTDATKLPEPTTQVIGAAMAAHFAARENGDNPTWCMKAALMAAAQAGRGEGVGGETIGGIMLAQAVNGYLAGKIGREDLRAAVQFMRAREGRQPVTLAQPAANQPAKGEE